MTKNKMIYCNCCGQNMKYDFKNGVFKCPNCNNVASVRSIKRRGFEFVSRTPKAIIENCKLPTRSTVRSAGYDFYCPCDITLEPNEQEKIWTGVKAYMQPDEVLLIDIRSSLGIKGLQLANTVGVIDSDYYNNPDNEGDICICLKNTSKEAITIKTGDKIAQGVFVKYLVADNDTATTKRKGGLGSTGK